MRAPGILLSALVAGTILLPLEARAFLYHADSIEGLLVDAATGKPLEGVVVVAHWQLRGAFEGAASGQLQISETTTDADGRYRIPSWGPKLALKGTLGGAAPTIIFFKPGYNYREVSNEPTSAGYRARSQWGGKTIALARYEGSSTQYANELQSLSDDLWLAGRASEPCGWESFPRMLKALASVDAQAQGAGPPTMHWRLKVNAEALKASGCRRLEEVLGK
jgi:hypothetical protein